MRLTHAVASAGVHAARLESLPAHELDDLPQSAGCGRAHGPACKLGKNERSCFSIIQKEGAKLTGSGEGSRRMDSFVLLPKERARIDGLRWPRVQLNKPASSATGSHGLARSRHLSNRQKKSN
eukprot:scaffold250438_cov18-Tisochrysis_lutea.AAC.1